MPDKAVDLVDEAASRLRLQQDSKPERIWKLEKAMATKKIEIEALRLEKDKASAARLKVLENEVSSMESEMSGMMEQWNKEKAALEAVTQKQLELEKARADLDNAHRSGQCVWSADLRDTVTLSLTHDSVAWHRWAKAGELLHGIIPKLEAELAEAEQVCVWRDCVPCDYVGRDCGPMVRLCVSFVEPLLT